MTRAVFVRFGGELSPAANVILNVSEEAASMTIAGFVLRLEKTGQRMAKNPKKPVRCSRVWCGLAGPIPWRSPLGGCARLDGLAERGRARLRPSPLPATARPYAGSHGGSPSQDRAEAFTGGGILERDPMTALNLLPKIRQVACPDVASFRAVDALVP
jgi:hypothetical protein